jgi:hypothetical protein
MENLNTILILSGLLAGAVNFFVNYLELPFPKLADEPNGNDLPKIKSLSVAIVGYVTVGLAGSFLTPLLNVIVGGLKGLEMLDDKPLNPLFNYILFGYGLVFGYSTTRLLLGILDSIIKRIGKVESSINKLNNNIQILKNKTILVTENAQDIINECEGKFEANKSDCSAFVKSVASAFSLSLSGQADDIIQQISNSDWTILDDGIDAKKKADLGWFVIAGLIGNENVPPQKNGHVAVIVAGQLAQNKYPTGYWGKLNDPDNAGKNKTINWAWNKDSRDKVKFYGKQV